jgi:hypothetical protein
MERVLKEKTIMNKDILKLNQLVEKNIKMIECGTLDEVNKFISDNKVKVINIQISETIDVLPDRKLYFTKYILFYKELKSK